MALENTNPKANGSYVGKEYSSSYPLENNPNPMYNPNSEEFKHVGIRRVTVGEELGSELLDAEAQLIRGTMSFSPQRLQELDPSYTGYTHVFVLRMPPVLTVPAGAGGRQLTGFEGKDVDGNQMSGTRLALAHCRNLKLLLEMGCTSYSGTPDLTLNSTQVQVGWAERAYAAPTYSAYDGTSFTLRCLELRGDKLRKGIEYYISAIADPSLKAATMNGALGATDTILAPTLSNMTWSFMIVQTDQTLLNIQDVSMWQNVIINGVDRSTLDWTNGEIDIVPPRDVQCNGVYVPDSHNPVVYKWAYKLLETRLKYYRRFSDMDESWFDTNSWANWTDEIGTNPGFSSTT